MRRLALLLLLVLGACAPQLQPPSTAAAAPQLLADRVIMNDGVALPLRQWQPAGQPKAVILALHGFNDYSFSFDAPAKTWAAAGIATFAYDQRGFGATPYRGLWAGEDRMMADLRTAAALLRARYPATPLYLLGESMGGSVIMAAAASTDPPRADGLILAAPAIWGRETQGPIQTGALWLAAHTVPWAELTGEGLHVHPSDNIAMLRQLGRDPLVIKETRVDAIYGLVNLMDLAYEAAPRLRGRVLVLYGSREDILPGSAVLATLHRMPTDLGRRPRVAFYRKGYHMLLRDLDAQLVRDDIAAWIVDPAAPLPSGGDALAVRLLATDDEDSVKAELPVTAAK
jgi:alpha-beta hydrolase superfamily lysophospholipase